jgi:hypothetical protein
MTLSSVSSYAIGVHGTLHVGDGIVAALFEIHAHGAVFLVAQEVLDESPGHELAGTDDRWRHIGEHVQVAAADGRTCRQARYAQGVGVTGQGLQWHGGTLLRHHEGIIVGGHCLKRMRCAWGLSGLS